MIRAGLFECRATGFEIFIDRKSFPVSIVPEFQNLITPLSAEERQGLKNALAKDSQREPFIIGCWRENEYVLLDGHNRYALQLESRNGEGLEHGLELSYEILYLADREAAKLWILENQVHRRNLTDDQRAIFWNEIREARSAKVRAEQLATAREGVSVETSDTEPAEKIDTRAAVAKEARLPERKLRAAQELKAAAPELAQQVRTGELTLRGAKQQIANRESISPAENEAVQEQENKIRSLESLFNGAGFPMQITRDSAKLTEKWHVHFRPLTETQVARLAELLQCAVFEAEETPVAEPSGGWIAGPQHYSETQTTRVQEPPGRYHFVTEAESCPLTGATVGWGSQENKYSPLITVYATEAEATEAQKKSVLTGKTSGQEPRVNRADFEVYEGRPYAGKKWRIRTPKHYRKNVFTAGAYATREDAEKTLDRLVELAAVPA
jgi:hypothetical protein